MGEYFRSTNEFNVATNALSGNILPLSNERINLSVTSLLWVTLTWIIKILHISSVFSGSLYFANIPVIEALKISGTTFAVCFEYIIPSIYLNLHRIDLQYLISRYNDIFNDSDEMKIIVQDTIRPYKKGLQLYIAACILTVSAWTAKPGLAVFTNDRFTYANYSAPAYFPGEPFGKKAFLGGIVMQIVGYCTVTFAKISIDIYISQFITVLAAQYKYVRAQIAKALDSERHQEDELSVIRALRNCVRHHCIVIEIGQKLTELLALQIGTSYISCVFKICFLSFSVVTLEGAGFDKCMCIVYGAGSILHIFLYCSCSQELFDLSTSVTEDGFHENWHGRSKSVKQLFYMMELSSQIECRLSAYRIIQLVVPTTAMVLSKAYSVCLLLMKMN